MKKRGLWMATGTAAAVACLGLALAAGAPAWAEEQAGETAEQQAPGMTEEQAAEMAAWMQLGQPGEHHGHLAKFVGDWKASGKFWMAPGQEPQVFIGTMKIDPILGGRFTQSTYTGEMMGMQFTGIGIDGYDNGSGHYVGYWMDSMSTFVMGMKGSCESDGKVRTMKGSYTDPQGKTIRSKGVTTLVGEKEFRYESYAIDADGNERKEMEIVFTRG